MVRDNRLPNWQGWFRVLLEERAKPNPPPPPPTLKLHRILLIRLIDSINVFERFWWWWGGWTVCDGGGGWLVMAVGCSGKHFRAADCRGSERRIREAPPKGPRALGDASQCSRAVSNRSTEGPISSRFCSVGCYLGLSGYQAFPPTVPPMFSVDRLPAGMTSCTARCFPVLLNRFPQESCHKRYPRPLR